MADTSGVLAYLDRAAAEHDACVRAVRSHAGPLLVSPFVLAELDYLLATRIGQDAALALLDEVAAGAYRLAGFDAAAVSQAAGIMRAGIMRQYADLELGLADASVVVLADRHDTDVILTLDERHFRAVARPGADGAAAGWRLLPADL